MWLCELSIYQSRKKMLCDPQPLDVRSIQGPCVCSHAQGGLTVL